jgi:hypothetical protein
MRARRVHQHGSPALRAAVEAGLVPAYRASEISRLPASQQEISVARWVNRSLLRTRGQAVAAGVIKRALRSSKVDLSEISSAIRAAIALTRL